MTCTDDAVCSMDVMISTFAMHQKHNEMLMYDVQQLLNQEKRFKLKFVLNTWLCVFSSIC